VISPLPKTPKSFEEDGRLALEEQQRRGQAYQREGDAERNPETGERPGIVDRITGVIGRVTDSIASHLPHPQG
jgi:hypothetical protein